MTKPGTSSLKGSVPQNIGSLMICISLVCPMKGGIEKKKGNLQTLSLFTSRETYIYIRGHTVKTDILSPDMGLVQGSLDSGFEAWKRNGCRRDRLLVWIPLLADPSGSDWVGVARTNPWDHEQWGLSRPSKQNSGKSSDTQFPKMGVRKRRAQKGPTRLLSTGGWSQVNYKLCECGQRPPPRQNFHTSTHHPKGFSSWAKPENWWQVFLVFVLGSTKGVVGPL